MWNYYWIYGIEKGITKKMDIENITNKKKETLGVIVTGRVYKRHKDFIDANDINVGKLVMDTLEKLNGDLKDGN